jgi:hypothetical protein
MAVAWPIGVNTDAYGMETTPMPNIERIEFDSGKSRTYLKNSTQKYMHSFLLSLDDSGDGSEYRIFVSWWNDVLKSGALSFTFPDLVAHSGLKEYRMTDAYSSSGQKRKEVSLSVEEM